MISVTAERRVTPQVIQAIYQMTLEKKTKLEISAVVDLSTDVIKRIRNGRYPSLDAASLTVWQETFGVAQAQEGGEPPARSAQNSLGAATIPADPFKRPTRRYSKDAQNKLAPTSSNLAEAAPEVPKPTETTGVDPMLLVNAGLSPETRKHFKLTQNPFVNDIEGPDDVYQTPSVRYVRAALTDCAKHHGFVAVIGESGAGKSTLAEDLQERIRVDGREIVIIKPYVLGMEGSDEKGKTLKSTQIAEAIATALDAHVVLKLSSEARFRQVHSMLTASRRGGHRHLLIIEEAHCLPIATLKHLKRFTELKDGMQRLLGVALIGQPELRDRLSGQNAEVREVAQRCELVTLDPLDAELEGYLQHKFARVGLKLDDVFEPDVYDAIRARLIYVPRGGRATDTRSICYPLVVNNLVCRALNAAAAIPWPKVDKNVIAGC